MAVIVQLSGGLGNQLFQYAAARRLALKNDQPLKVDMISGFNKDSVYNREYLLHQFSIQATPASKLASYNSYGSRTLRNALGKINRALPSQWVFYIRENVVNGIHRVFEPRLLDYQVRWMVYLDGHWETEKYFKDIEDILIKDFEIKETHLPDTLREADMIRTCESVCVGIRSYSDAPPEVRHIHTPLHENYYLKAMDLINTRVSNPRFFVFTDNPEWARKNISFNYPVIFLTPRLSNDLAREDLWLMTLCKHFIISTSTFHWWGAWLSRNPAKVVVAPATRTNNQDMIPDHWIKLT